MQSPLMTLCLVLWIAGSCGMLALKGGFEHGPGSDLFTLAQGFWATGGLGYALMGLLFSLEPDAPQQSQEEQRTPEDLSRPARSDR